MTRKSAPKFQITQKLIEVAVDEPTDGAQKRPRETFTAINRTV